ncbi:MAG: DUF3783 domain-containing protein [Gemmiger sp.]
MKAHIAKEPRCALLWQIAPTARLELLAKAYRCRLRVVTAADLGATVGDLCAGRPSPAQGLPMQAAVIPALIVSGMRHDDGELGAFLDAVRSAGFDIPLRAMVTATSRDWTLAALLQELHAEHTAVGGEA